jgi:transposase-like protein
MEDIQNLFKETIAEFMENGLDAELDTELGYSKYDYRNKETDNSRNGHSSKTLRTSFGDVEVSVPRDRQGKFEPQLLKRIRQHSQDIEEKILSMHVVVFLDDIHYHACSEGQIVKKTVYIATGINLDGKKDVPGMRVGENESAKYWANVLNGIRNRGVQDIFISCTDNLTGPSTPSKALTGNFVG